MSLWSKFGSLTAKGKEEYFKGQFDKTANEIKELPLMRCKALHGKEPENEVRLKTCTITTGIAVKPENEVNLSNYISKWSW